MKSLKYITSAFVVLVIASLVGSCSTKKSYPEVDFVSLKGSVDSVLAGKTIYLADPLTLETEDSTMVDPTLHFAFADLSRYKDKSIVMLLSADYAIGNYHFDITMPVVIENGDLHVLFGENQAMTGSVNNDELNKFLLQLNYFSALAREKSHEQVRKEFSDYLKDFVRQNKDNALSAYVSHFYADKMLP